MVKAAADLTLWNTHRLYGLSLDDECGQVVTGQVSIVIAMIDSDLQLTRVLLLTSDGCLGWCSVDYFKLHYLNEVT